MYIALSYIAGTILCKHVLIHLKTSPKMFGCKPSNNISER